jgi:hypothetical protein
MEIYTSTSTAVSAWAPTGALCVSPNAQFQGTGLSVATPAYVITDGMGLPGADKARHTVPDPRGRHR